MRHKVEDGKVGVDGGVVEGPPLFRHHHSLTAQKGVAGVLWVLCGWWWLLCDVEM